MENPKFNWLSTRVVHVCKQISELLIIIVNNLPVMTMNTYILCVYPYTGT